MQPKRNIAARAARWSAGHRKVAIFGWLAFVVASVVIGGAVGIKELTSAEADSRRGGPRRGRARRGPPDPNSEVVLVQSDD